MGYVSDCIRLTDLSGQRRDLKNKIQQITMTRQELKNINNDLMKPGTTYDPNSPVMKTMQERQEKIRILEDKLAQEMESYSLQLDAVEAERKACLSRIKEETVEEFTYSLTPNG